MTYIEALTELAELLPESWDSEFAHLQESGSHVSVVCAMALIKLMSGVRIERQHDGKWAAWDCDGKLFDIGDTITEAVVRLAVKVLRARKEEA